MDASLGMNGDEKTMSRITNRCIQYHFYNSINPAKPCITDIFKCVGAFWHFGS